MKSSIKKFAIVILKIAVSVSALFFVFSKIQFSQVFLLYKNIETGWVILAGLAFIISKFIAALRLNRFFQSIEIQLSEIQNIKLLDGKNILNSEEIMVHIQILIEIHRLISFFALEFHFSFSNLDSHF